MNFLIRLRPLLVFLLVSGLGVGVVLLATGDSDRPPRRGIHIPTVPSLPEEAVSLPGVPLDGLPALLAAKAPEVTRFETVLLPGENGLVATRFLAWHLKVREMEVKTQRALRPVFSLYPEPTSLEQARRFLATPPDRSVVIRSGEASILRGKRSAPTGDDDLPDQWILTLLDEVHVESLLDDRRIELDGERLEVEATDRRVRGVGPVAITADEYFISGRGLSGNAELGTFSVEEDIEVLLPTAALARGADMPPDAKSRITCAGPLTVERLGRDDEEGATRTRVRFETAVRVEGDALPDRPPDVLTAEELVILLVVRKDPPKGVEPVTVRRVEASGGVVLARGSDSRAECSGLVIDRVEGGEEVTMDGPVHVRHRGLLPVAVGGEEAEEARLTVDASRSARLTARGGASDAVFTGTVVARRLGPEDRVLLELGAEQITVTSDPKTGDRMLAAGGASFSTPAAEGEADSIEWSRTPEGREVTVLDGSPTVTLAGGGNFDLMKAAPQPEPGDSAGDEVMVLSSSGRMELVKVGEVRTFSMQDQVSVVRKKADVELMRVRAGEANGEIRGQDLSSLTATGSVVANGQEGDAAWFASGETLAYEAADEIAVLTGAPALVRLLESEERVNAIEADRLIFASGGKLLTAEDAVKAVVFLPETKGRQTSPFTLRCDRLDIVPAEKAEVKDDEFGPGRIASLTADGHLVLTGRDRTANGDRLVYTGLGERELVLTGAPAYLTQRQDLGGTEYEDRYESVEFRLKLFDRDIDSFVAPKGGSFRLYRPYGKGAPAVLGNPSAGAGAVERIQGSAERSLFYDTKTARMTGRARLEQHVGQDSDFRRVATFTAEEITATRGLGPSGRPELLTVTGRGGVRGTGEKWELICRSFDVDLVKHRTKVVGSPAEVIRNGSRLRVSQAVYDYESGDWIELVNFRSR